MNSALADVPMLRASGDELRWELRALGDDIRIRVAGRDAVGAG